MAAKFEPDPKKIQEATFAQEKFNRRMSEAEFGAQNIDKSLQKQLKNYGNIIESAKKAYDLQKMGADDLEEIVSLTGELANENKDLNDSNKKLEKNLKEKEKSIKNLKDKIIDLEKENTKIKNESPSSKGRPIRDIYDEDINMGGFWGSNLKDKK